MIADTRGVSTAMRKDDQDWIAAQGADFVGQGLQSIITILPQSALTQLSNKGWQKRVAGNDGGFVMEDVGSLEDAKALIATLEQRKAA